MYCLLAARLFMCLGCLVRVGLIEGSGEQQLVQICRIFLVPGTSDLGNICSISVRYCDPVIVQPLVSESP